MKSFVGDEEDVVSPSDAQVFADKLLSQELLKLNMDDRNSINEEIHGVRSLAPRETPELLARGLREFQIQLERLPVSKRTGYDACLQYAEKHSGGRPHYAVHDPIFRLRFLRCELFDATKAALRFANYLNFTLKGWGRQVVKRPIQFSDFTTVEAKLFRKGYYQLLPFRDQSGRRVLVLVGRMTFQNNDFTELQRSKVLFYLWDVVSREDIETQQRGIVVVADISSWSGIDDGGVPMSKEARIYMTESFAAIPTRTVANHVCLPDRPVFRLFSYLLVLDITGHAQKLRLKFHYVGESDSGLRVRYELKGYGIPIELLPLTDTGSIKTKFLSDFIRFRRLVESESDLSPKETFFDCPGSNDVVFKKGKTMLQNPGNAMLRSLVLNILESDNERTSQNQVAGDYDSMGISEKWSVLGTIFIERKTRFLEWDMKNMMWKQITDVERIQGKLSNMYHKLKKKLQARSPELYLAGASQHKQSILDHRHPPFGCIASLCNGGQKGNESNSTLSGLPKLSALEQQRLEFILPPTFGEINGAILKEKTSSNRKRKK